MSEVTLFVKHLFWAYRCWCEENTGRAHIVIKEDRVTETYLKKYIRNGVLVLNVSSTAIRDLSVEETEISFVARFGGQPRDITIKYDDIFGFVSPIDGSLLPLNVIPLRFHNGEVGRAVITKIEPETPVPVKKTPEPTKAVESDTRNTTIETRDDSKVVKLSDVRKKRTEDKLKK